MTLRRKLGVFAEPALILPVLLAGALLAVAFNLGDLGHVMDRVRAISIPVMLFALGMGLTYLTLKLWQFHLLLANLGLHPGWRRLLLAFAVGELAVTLPFGIFAQNWVLSTAGGQARFGRSSAATVVMLLVETLVVLLLLAIVGIPRWPQLQPIAAVFAVGFVALTLSILRFERLARKLAIRLKQPLLHRAAVEILGLLRGLKRLSHPRTLAINVVLAAAYLGALAFAFMAVGRSVGVQNLPYLTAATIYAFSLAVVLICGGLVSQIGTVEILGMGAALAWGLNFTEGLALMLGFRLVWTGVMWLINLPIVFLLWRSLHSRAPVAERQEDARKGDHAKEDTEYTTEEHG